MSGRLSSMEVMRAPLERVTPLALPGVRLTRWGAVTLVAVAAVVIVGVRRDWALALWSGPAWLHSSLLAATAACGAWAALRLAIPGEAKPGVVAWPLALAGAWVASVVGELATGAVPFDVAAAGLGWRCIVRAAVGASIPGSVLFMLVQRAYPLNVRPTAVALATSTVAVGELAAEWMCPNMRVMHLLAWHVAPLVAVVALAAIAPRLVVGRDGTWHGARPAGEASR